jgi:hypothetical protein
VKGNIPHLDDLVLRRIQCGGFDIQQQAEPEAHLVVLVC